MISVLQKSLREEMVDAAQVGAAVGLGQKILADEQFFESWRQTGEHTGGWMEKDMSEWERLLATMSELQTPFDGKKEVEQMLRELELRDPQFRAVGGGDGNVWICKPSNLSQGRGIVLCNSLQELLDVTSFDEREAGMNVSGTEKNKSSSLPTKWVVQKYIERPLLLQNGRKFDIRQWVLLTALEPKPTAFWFYRSYLRFCAKQFELSRLQDRFTHLSNYSVQQHFFPREDSGPEAESNDIDRQFEPMWSSERFRDILT
ncbi:unnamed protein product [Phytophthora lilii]|uniref:Unnamed protein product n=1 Tax=Phytophthora lilii TaxID=2077276 RepID=A0A9W6X2P0_9STRA|nr:unnamed protein product [Phytophthora lilii]